MPFCCYGWREVRLRKRLWDQHVVVSEFQLDAKIAAFEAQDRRHQQELKVKDSEIEILRQCCRSNGVAIPAEPPREVVRQHISRGPSYSSDDFFDCIDYNTSEPDFNRSLRVLKHQKGQMQHGSDRIGSNQTEPVQANREKGAGEVINGDGIGANSNHQQNSSSAGGASGGASGGGNSDSRRGSNTSLEWKASARALV